MKPDFVNLPSTTEDQPISANQKILRLAKDVQLDKALYLRLVQKWREAVSGPILSNKAKQFNEQLPARVATTPPLIASAGWLWRLCNRHGIRELRLQGEKLSHSSPRVSSSQDPSLVSWANALTDAISPEA